MAKHANYLVPYLKPANCILDVGCGPATITCGYALCVPQGSVVGIVYSSKPNVSFTIASAYELLFPDESFDIVHCDAVLVHLPNACAALIEMRRVCKVGGIVAAREPDWSTCIIHPYNPHLERWKDLHIQLEVNEGVEPNAGRHLAEWAVRVGFVPELIQITSDLLQYAGKDEVKWWGELYASRMKTGFGKRGIENGVASTHEMNQFEAAYLPWSKSDIGIWALVHMRLLCWK